MDVIDLRRRLGVASRLLRPGLAIVQVGGREDSNVYIRMKCRAAEEIGIAAKHVQLARSCTQTELLNAVR